MSYQNGISVFFVRHGQTVYNMQKRLQGWKDSPLSEEGTGHSQMMGKALQDQSFTHVWVSPLGRAIQTANIMQEYIGFEYDTTDDLREVSFGDWEGLTLPEINEQYPGMWDERQNDKWNYIPPGGESNHFAQARAQRMKDRIEACEAGSRILIIAHFAINRLVVSQLMDMQPDDVMRMNVPHGILYRLQQHGCGWEVSWQMADQLHEGFQDGWLPQYVSENQLIQKY